jgi:drug/metabolite transporter (DMT)-like permease
MLTGGALCAFAGNALLTRLALGRMTIDAVTFSTLRLASGAGMLVLVTALKRGSASRLSGSWRSAFTLFLYAVPYSYAYLNMSAGTGALVFIGSVQITMICAALLDGERPLALQWLGFGFALAGLIYLLLPGFAAPPVVSSVAMTLAGLAWGGYSLLGRRATCPLEETTSNFVRAIPFVLLIDGLARADRHLEPAGVGLALVCGAVTSGLGYVLWYAAVRGQSSTRAAIVQLPVPVLAGTGGVLFLGETLSWRLMLSATMVLGGIGLTLVNREQPE